MYRIGIDVGGTFTDFTLLDDAGGLVRFHKVPSTPQDPAAAIRQGIGEMLDLFKVDPAKVSGVGHGTTVATNIVIERKGAPTGLLVTKGFRDTLEIARQTRPSLYDYRVKRPAALARREHRIEIAERRRADGSLLQPLDEAEVRAAAEQLKQQGIKAVAVCFLHAYRNAEHEERVGAILQEVFPEAYVTLSSSVLREFREYERMSTTVVNAYVGPRMKTYLDRFRAGVKELGIPVEPYTVHSNGGLMSPRTAGEFPVRSCLSGPAAGVVGAAVVGAAAGFPNLVTFDAGGTSTDVSLVADARPQFTSTRLVAEHPVKTPMIDIHVIGAGGGSIAWLDDAGALKVGPHSAGADPGPVAYGKGGTEPTISDAHVVLGRLDPTALLGGRVPVDAAAARRAIEEKVAKPLGISVERAAHGIIRIANANIARAIRSVSTERGYDLRQFALFAFGGAGPLHAAVVAAAVGIPSVLVPEEPGTMCARGILLSDINLDFVKTEFIQLGTTGWERVAKLFDEMRAQAEAWLEQEKVPAADRFYRSFVEARYQGQNHEIAVELEAVEHGAFLERFIALHRQEYGYDIPDRTIEVVNCRIQAIGRVPKAPLAELKRAGKLADAVTGHRKVWFDEETGWVDTPIYDRGRLPVDQPVPGPAIAVEMSSTTVILPKQTATLDRLGNIIIRSAA